MVTCACGWVMVNQDGSLVDPVTLPPRPKDARKMEDHDPYTPWYKQEEHLHVKGGKITGLHAKGSIEEVQRKLFHCLEYENMLLTQFGNDKDIFLKDALSFLREQGK